MLGCLFDSCSDEECWLSDVEVDASKFKASSSKRLAAKKADNHLT